MINKIRSRTTHTILLVSLVISSLWVPAGQARATETPAAGSAIYLPFITNGGAPATNLLSNGSFESGNLNGWTPGGATASSAQAHSGQWSARLANTQMRAQIPTLPGQTYKVTAWIKIVSESGSDWGGFRLVAYGANWKEIGNSGTLLTASDGSAWFKVALMFTAELASTPLDVGYFGGSGRTLVAHVDDLMAFAKGANQPPTLSASLNPLALSTLPQTQQFSLTADDPDGAVVSVLWDFGDGARAMNRSGMRRVALAGNYLATVSVADDEGVVVTQTIPWAASASGFPALTIASPAATETTVNAAVLPMSGSTSGSVASVRVSSDRDYLVTASGTASWSVNVQLQPGLNRLLVQAQGANGRTVTQERRVRYVPAAPLSLALLTTPASVQRWDVIEITARLDNSAATHPQFPYDPNPPQGLRWIEGVSVDALFTPDNWVTVYRRPAFLYQPYQRQLKDNQEWLYPAGEAVWMVRFAPPRLGAWKYRLEAREAKGTAQSTEQAFTVTAPTNANNHGPVRVAPNDTRYFEFADGTPFLGTGHGLGSNEIGADRFSYDAADTFNTMGGGNEQFFRWWISGNLWGSAWQPWRSRTLSNDAYLPATGLSLDETYGNGLASLRLDAANPLMFQGFDSGHAALISGKTYRLRVRWRTENVTGPAIGGQPYGVTVKLTGWPEPGQTGSISALIPHVNGDTPWHMVEASFTASGNFLPNLALILENTTGGAAYIDEVTLREVLANGALGPQLLRSPRFDSLYTFDLRRGAGLDAVFADASARGLSFKLVISEKNEYLLNRLAPGGLPDPNGGHFNDGEGTPARWLHTAYWRHLFARFGAYRSIHSWELVNEEAPGPGAHFRLTAALAALAAADGNPHLATTSTWATLAESAWKDPASAPIAYTDFHAYVRGTGWIEPKDQLANDSARFFNEYDLAARAAGFGKPVVWGEQGIDGNNGTDYQDSALANDNQGVWLHKMTWARSGPGGVYPLYWYTEHIFDKSLFPIYGAWNKFMAGIPLTNGRYQDIAATTSNSNLRAFGQKDLTAGWAHVWLDNRQHTWRAVANGAAIASVSGTVTISLQRANAHYTVTWYNTQTGAPANTQTLTASADGALTLTVSNLATDTAARITWNGN